ncbi:MAG: biotin--[acetyl-CoA-carboxylase] ligase [Ignavibacteria bacterium GWA2_35_9]|nr:MAG: biotin--[acetyl-CoA-carboxylase] ligase [Ignavibacteria bacterium GWA2_35_9]OGU51779.1 MAG: biotin--[acetyl-CoA-carboxylase] ligase [Ignavibacteria bacterium GWC2_36_12]OGV01862.1 MAG: biotin--[acetyl-CoA-carboxylase] ligase [Ignavibacteria bacterium RIFOXYA2_FULL_37_17]OGV04652.1 MAG: biotin--[acetyl-CoA-carboxylase] ligase [Ignavibacteria bacterium RIFOXYB2_FULL_36_7]
MESVFNLENFDIKLDTEIIGRNIIYIDETPSTNSFLLDPAISGNTNGTILIAEKQIKGRGRKDRQWYSTKGLNLTFSILLTNKKYFTKRFNLINFATALSTAIAIENLFQSRTELKWPNDVLINKKKVAGVLIESTSKGEKIERVVIGIGINVNQTSFQGSFNVQPTSLKNETGGTVIRETLLAELLNVFEETLEQVISNYKWILKEWKQRCGMIGERISVSDGEKTKNGIFDDIDENGFMILKNKDKVEKIYFGDVSIV